MAPISWAYREATAARADPRALTFSKACALVLDGTVTDGE